MLSPVNRYLVVEILTEEKKDSGVLVPEDYKVNNYAFSAVKLLAKNSNSKLEDVFVGQNLVVPSHMIEEIALFGETHHVVLENNVVGYFDN